MKLSSCTLVFALVLCSARAFAAQAGAPGFQTSTTFLDFNPTMVGGLVKSTTPAVTPVITNTGTATLNITSATISNPEFFFSPASVVLPVSVAPGASTSPFVIVFTPSGPGKQTGELVLQDDAAGSPHTIQLIGFGLDVAPGDFALAAPDNNTNLLSQSLPAGATAEYSFSITGSPNNISLTCSGAPQGAFCSLPSSVTLNSASVLGSDSTVPIVVKVATSGPTAGLQTMRTSLWWTLAIAVGLAFAAGRRRGARAFVFAFCTAAMMTSMVTCGGGNSGSPGTPAGSYTLTVTATGNGGTVHTIPLKLFVRPFGTP